MRSSFFHRASVIALSAMMPVAAQAQVQSGESDPGLQTRSGTTNPTAPQEINADGTQVDQPGQRTNDIVVTGSRIRLPNVENIEPTVTVNQQYIEDRGLTNVADALNELPGIRGSVTPNGAQGSFGQGVNFINLFSLGSNRTLTLVNGRRYVSSNVTTIFNQGSAGTQVDVNVIPTLLVDHVEIQSIGGAPTYGSDAIAGTINYILDTRLKGIRAQIVSGVTEQGDGFRYNASIAGGFDFAGGRGNLTASYTRDVQNGVLYNDREFYRHNVSGGTNPSNAQAAALRGPGITPANDGRLNPNIGYNNSTTDGFPGTVLIRNRTIFQLTQGGLITDATRGTVFNAANRVSGAVQSLQFDGSGNLTPFNNGIRFAGSTEASGGDGFRFNDYSQITSQVKRDIFNGFAGYDVSDAVKFFAEGTYFHSRGDELVQQPTFNSSLFGAGLSGPLTFDVNSPFLTTQARTQLQALGVNRFQVSRASIDLADLTGFSTNDLYRGVVGARGEFNIGGRTFNYEASANYGRVDIVDTRQDLNAQKFINAVNVTRDAAGQTVCTATPAFQAAFGGTPDPDAACVPLNLLGLGLSDPAARAYVVSQNVTRSRLEELVFNVNAGGSPFKLFGNETGFNIGFEHRQEKGQFTPSQFEQQGLGRAVAISPISGKYNIDAAFGEVRLPLVTPNNNLRFLHTLDVFGKGRYVDNTVNGGFFAWSAGGQIGIIKDIIFRGNYTKSFRAPAITELFSPLANVFNTVPDLCSPGNRAAGPVPAIRTANCNAFLAKFPNATPLDAAGATVPGLNGGNRNLQNEVAKSFTYGIVLQPRFIPGFSLTVDYVNIKITQPIANLSVTQIAQACFDNSNFDTADPANGNAFCSLIQRYAAGQGGTAVNGGDRGGQVVSDPTAPGVISGFRNGNRIKFDGIQAQMSYLRPLSGLGIPGNAGIDGNFFYVRTRINDITGVAPTRIDGTEADPTFQGQLNLRYVGDSFGLVMSANYIGEQLFSRVSRGPDIREIDKLDDFVILNPSVYVQAAKNFRLTFSVTNLLNRNGQRYYGELIPASITDSGGDALGRRFSVAARASF